LVLENYVKLMPGVPVRLHFVDHSIIERQITDPIRGVPVKRRSLVFYVDERDGVKVDLMYSVVSEKHADDFAGYLPDKSYVRYTFTVVKDAAGTVPPRILETRPR